MRHRLILQLAGVVSVAFFLGHGGAPGRIVYERVALDAEVGSRRIKHLILVSVDYAVVLSAQVVLAETSGRISQFTLHVMMHFAERVATTAASGCSVRRRTTANR